jgi:hypothetical protein
LEKYFVYTLCAKEFGWKPEEVDKIDVVTLQYILHTFGQMIKKQNEAMKV